MPTTGLGKADKGDTMRTTKYTRESQEPMRLTLDYLYEHVLQHGARYLEAKTKGRSICGDMEVYQDFLKLT